MFFIYGAANSRACDRVEFILYTLGHDYRFYIYGKDYDLNQLQRLIPNCRTVPQIYYGTKYIGGLRELYEYLQPIEENSDEKVATPKSIEYFLNLEIESESGESDESGKKT
jgi:glutaredoxin